MDQWIGIRERQPPLKQLVLVAGKEGSYFKKLRGKNDTRPMKVHIGHFYDDYAFFEDLKPKIEFAMHCKCPSNEHVRNNLEILFWMPLPQLPETT